ncbi:MAG: DUF4118 domain-containing protein [Lentisphaerota bacterium]
MNVESKWRPTILFSLFIGLSLLIDWIDIATGEDYELFILYFIPVSLAAWKLGLRTGVILAVFSSITWFQSDWFVAPHHSVLIEAWDTLMRLGAFLALAVTLSRIRKDLDREKKLNSELTEAMSQIKQLQGILPMCSFCRKIRDKDQHWIRIEKYISEHSDAQVSHGLCPDCYKKYYGSADGT